MRALRTRLEHYRPKGLSWDNVIIVCMQALIGLMLLYMIVGAELGFVQRTHPPEPGSEWVGPVFGLWSVLALVTSVGLLRNRWWAYFAEILVVLPVPLMIAIFGIDKLGDDKVFGVLIPGAATVRYIIFLIAALSGFWLLYKRGMLRYREQVHASRA